MRRSKCEISREDAWKVFDESDYASIGCIRKDGTPYVVNVSMARIGEVLYFHCAMEGEKNDSVQMNPRVCVNAVGNYHIVQEKFTVFYASVVIEGCIQEVQEEDEKREALKAICLKYTPDYMSEFESAVDKSIAVTAIYKIKVNSITGKKK
ncbi:pyridoxamine 5'-phosphate oxidase family protein [Amedibacillus sp. YH-ame10]